MKGFLVNLFTPKKYKIMFKKLQECLKNKKSYIIGAGIVIQGISMIVDTFTGFESLGQFVDWIGTAMQSKGMLTIMNGFGLMGLRAGIGKVKVDK